MREPTQEEILEGWRKTVKNWKPEPLNDRERFFLDAQRFASEQSKKVPFTLGGPIEWVRR